MTERADIVIIGAGAAGLFAGLFAARRSRELSRPRRILILDGARTLGAKILVAGGGRCNVTHHAVTERDFSGSTQSAIRTVLRRFTVEDTTHFFAQRNLHLKREPTGKLFPTTDRARDVLNAILDATREAGAVIRHPCRVEQVSRNDNGFLIHANHNSKPATIHSKRLILATGGKALPKSGSDGTGYTFARDLGHTLTPRIFPALVPLITHKKHPLRDLSGLSFEGTLQVRASTNKRLAQTQGSILCTHFGLSGPAILDISRHLIAARFEDPGAALILSFLPTESRDSLDNALQTLGPSSIPRFLKDHLPERLAQTVLNLANVPPQTTGATLRREQRRALIDTLLELPLPITADRGYTHAEVTAGGVPLKQLTLRTMESRTTPSLHLCGEICDVDGRIGGFNFQWAWASGYIAGTAAADAIAAEATAHPPAQTKTPK